MPVSSPSFEASDHHPGTPQNLPVVVLTPREITVATPAGATVVAVRNRFWAP